MTNYKKWETFDEDKVLAEIDEREKIVGSKQARNRPAEDLMTKTSNAAAIAREEAEILQSQAAVAALKAKGGGSKRRRNKAESTDSIPLPPSVDVSGELSTVTNNSTKQPTITPPSPKFTLETPEAALLAISEFLYNLLQDVNTLQPLTTSVKDHHKGLQSSFKILTKICTFNQLKYFLPLICREEKHLILAQEIMGTEEFLLNQTMTCLGLFGLSTGSFSLTIDCTRHVLRTQGNDADAGIWIMRGMAFLGMGQVYLAHVHFRQAMQKSYHGDNSDYPGLKEALPFLHQQEVAYVKHHQQATTQQLVTQEINRGLFFLYHSNTATHSTSQTHFLSKYPDLACITIDQLTFLLEAGGTLTTAATESHNSGYDLDDENNVEDKKYSSNDNLNNVSLIDFIQHNEYFQLLLQQLQHRQHSHSSSASSSADSIKQPTIVTLIALIHRLFYKAQLFFLENCFHAAEIRYLTTLLLLSELNKLYLQTEASSVTEIQDIKAMASVVLINLAMCRYHRHHLKNNSHHPHNNDNTFQFDLFSTENNWFDIISTIESSSALTLSNYAISIFDHPIFHLRKVEVLIKMHLYIEALTELDLLSTLVSTERNHTDSQNESQTESEGEGTKESKSVLVGDYGKNRVLSQLYLTGLQLPLTHTPSPENIAKVNGNSHVEVEQAMQEISTILNTNSNSTTATNVDLDELHHKIPSVLPRSDCQVSKREWQDVITVTRIKLEFLCRQHGLSP